MIKKDFTEDTKYIELGDNKKYCAYCGKEIPEDVYWDEYDRSVFYHCDCETALEELKIKGSIRELADKLDEKKYELRKFHDTKTNYTSKKVLQKLPKK